VYDLADTLCLADGPAPVPLVTDSAAPSPTAAARQRLLSPLAKLTEKLRSNEAASTADGKAAKKTEKAPPTVGFVPPRREIGEDYIAVCARSCPDAELTLSLMVQRCCGGTTATRRASRTSSLRPSTLVNLDATII
jgi:hypothetical protein